MRLSARTALAFTAALATVALAGPTAPAATAAAAPARPDGWLRLAHFSPGTPPVDVYLYPFGGSSAAMVLKAVSYGHASPYETVAAGQYTVAMRAAGTSAAAAPVISSTVRVAGGHAYTVAGLGPKSALQLRTLPDRLTAPANRSAVRVIQASLSQPSVAVRVAGGAGTALRFPAATGYREVSAGATTVRVSAGAASTSRTVELTGRSTHTLVVLSSGGTAPGLLDLTDSAGPNREPAGGVDAGYGGLGHASRPRASVTPAALGWSGLLLLGCAAVAVSTRRLRRRPR